MAVHPYGASSDAWRRQCQHPGGHLHPRGALLLLGTSLGGLETPSQLPQGKKKNQAKKKNPKASVQKACAKAQPLTK